MSRRSSPRPVTPAHRRGRRRAVRSLLVLLLVAGAVLVSGGPAGAGAPASAAQLITVETASASATTGTLRAWERVGGGWRLARGPYPVFVGGSGVGQAREGSSTTPAGTYPLTEAFGRLPNPGTAMPWFQSDTQDWWDGNPSSPTYNLHVRRSSSPGGASENLYGSGPVYDYAVNIGYNLGRVPGAGSAIFLHVSNGRPTAGCVSMDREALAGLLRWLRPDAEPHIMINVAPVRNAIADAWYRTGGVAGPLGLPAGGEGGLPDGRGIAQWFQGGPVYWSGATGAHPVVNGNLQAWARKGYENGPLRYPTTDEGGLPDGRGIAQWFQGGAVYWTAATGSRSVVGGNLQAWARTGYENGPLRYPTTDEGALPDGRGIAQWFQGGAVYWTAATGSRSVVGGNLQAWARTGYENGPLRYPTTDEGALPDGRGIAQWFQGGAVYWSPATGSHALTGALLQAWIGRGAENGPLGYPLTDTYAVTGGTRIDFQGGTLTLDTATGTVR